MKKVARAPARASASSTAGVPSGCGPSSNVSATAPGIAIRVGIRSAPATDGTIGASDGNDQSPRPPTAPRPGAGSSRGARVSSAELVGGIALAAAAAACFDGAVALQALEARALRGRAVGAGLLRGPASLARAGSPQPLWRSRAGRCRWPRSRSRPLTVVQPALALGLVLLLALGSRLLGEPVRRRDLAAVAAIAAGLALLAWAAPESERVHANAAVLATVLGGLALIALVPWFVRARLPGGALVIAAGCGYAASGVTSKLLADNLELGSHGAAVGWAALHRSRRGDRAG